MNNTDYFSVILITIVCKRVCKKGKIMYKKILSLLIAGIMLTGFCFNEECFAAPKDHHNDRPFFHRIFNFHHKDSAKKTPKHKKPPVKKQKIKKKNSEHRWFKWRKDKPAVHKKHQEKKRIKWIKKDKKQKIHKQKKAQKRFFKFKRGNNSHRRHR